MEKDNHCSKHKVKINAKQIAGLYINKWWGPAVTSIVLLFFVFVFACVSIIMPESQLFIHLTKYMLIPLGLSFLGILTASIWNFIRKHWALGAINLLMFPALLLVTLLAFGFIMVTSMLGPTEDGFANNLTIPNNIEIEEPLDWSEEPHGGTEDTFQAKLLAALETPGNDDSSVTADLPSLEQLHKNAHAILVRYLATSPSWRVFYKDSRLFATRRWMIGSHWRYEMHGYYTRYNLEPWHKAGLTNFQSRLTLGFSGKPWSRVSGNSTHMQQGKTANLKLSIGNQMEESHCIIAIDQLIVEIFEQSEARERRLTKAALAHLEDELRPLALSPEWSTIQSILPSGAIRRGEPTIELRKSLQPGLYDSIIWVNPGEPGMIYLKAYEVTQECLLSSNRLKEYSNESVGWSDDPEELFFSNTHFTIYEGDWGKPYAARFEVWFVPDSKNMERKLIEKTFKIEGWQR